MPRYFWITVRGWVVAYAMVSAVVIAYPLVVGVASAPWWASAGFFLLWLLPILCFFLFAGAVIRLRRRVTESGALVCPRCGQDLRGVPEPGRCPECGREFTLEQLRVSWRRFLRT